MMMKLIKMPMYLLSALLLCLAGCRQKPAANDQPFFFDFESEAELNSFKWQCHQLLEPSAEHATHGETSLKVEMYPSSPYPGLKILDFDPDWSNDNALHFDVFNPQKDSLVLDIRIDDQEDNTDFANCFNTRITLPPGADHHVLSFDHLVASGDGRRLDLKSIEKVYLYLSHPADKNTLYFDYLHLE